MPGLEIVLKPIESEADAALAEMSGAIDGNTVASFQQTLEEIKTKGIRRLVLDMSKIKYVNSTGLGSLVKYADAFKSSGGGMALIKVPAKVKIVIEMLGLNAFFDICQDLQQALQALEKTGAGGAPAQPAATIPKATAKGPPSGAFPTAARPASPPPAMPAGASATGAPAQPTGSTQRIKRPGFPAVLPCGVCGVQVEFRDAGNWKCPRCHAVATVKPDGTARFSRPERQSPVTLTLPATPDCGEGLLHLVTSVCTTAFNGGHLDAVRTAVHEVAQVMQQSVYAGNPNGVYHVSIDRQPGRVVIRVADAGATIDGTRIGQYFPQATRSMDEFECRPHPTGGNLIRMVKKG